MPLILGTNSIKDTGYNVANSLRFDSTQGTYLNFNQSTPTSAKKMTYSTWLKISKLNDYNILLENVASPHSGQIVIQPDGDNNDLRFYDYDGSTNIDLRTSQAFRDVSAWYHIVVAMDTTQSTASNRVKIYVNGSQVTAFDVETYPDQNYDTAIADGTLQIGRQGSSIYYLDGYLAETVFIDGLQLAPTDFGEFDEDSPTIWKPKDVSGLTFGNNGFYLDFENSGALGTDAGGSNNLTTNNITAVDQSTDTCTNNFATMNPLDNFYPASTFTEGNLKIVSGSSPFSSNTATFGLSSGKWYYEFKYLARGGSEDLWHVGIKSTQDTANDQMLGHFANDYGYRAFNGKVRNNNGDITYGNTFAINDIIGVYIDLDNSKLYFAKNGTVQNSGTGISITAVASTPLGVYLPAISWNDGSTTGTCSLNFGSPEFSISSGNTDANGYGNFEYDPSSGTFDSASKSFYAINTKNLAEFG